MADSRTLWGTGVSIVIVVALGMSWASRASSVHEISLVARGMAFYVEGTSVANPTMQVRAGDRIRIVLKNEASGLRHDLAVPSLSAVMSPVEPGSSGVLEFDAPAQPGRLVYECRPHAQMMHGMIEVTPEP
jgi:plastocyanin